MRKENVYYLKNNRIVENDLVNLIVEFFRPIHPNGVSRLHAALAARGIADTVLYTS